MSREIFDYLKCAYHNTGVLLGYSGIFASLSASALAVAEVENLQGKCAIVAASTVVGFNCFLLLDMTDYGRETVNAYVRVREHIAKFGRLDERFKKKFKPTYCNAVGINLAVDEAGLEERL